MLMGNFQNDEPASEAEMRNSAAGRKSTSTRLLEMQIAAFFLAAAMGHFQNVLLIRLAIRGVNFNLLRRSRLRRSPRRR